MKLIHKLIFVGAASVMPSALAPIALADQRAEATPIAYSIALNSSVKPVSNSGLNYPSAAALRGESGFCDVRFDITRAGQTANVSVVSCTSEAFRREAKRLAAGLRYDRPGSDIAMRIRWTLEPPKVKTASLP